MNQPSLNILEWDSNFFGFQVGRIEGTITSASDLIQIENLIKEYNVQLCYHSSALPLSLTNLPNEAIEIKLVDRKTTYAKNINPICQTHSSVTSIDSTTNHDKIVHLAIQSGIYSRFNVDSRINKRKFEELYGIWATRSINKEIAKEVLVYKTEGVEAGFVTLGEKNCRADIGIVAVDQQYRRMGIGKALMQSAERWFHDSGFTHIQVVTQGDNMPACKLYESAGFTVETVEYFYHIWANCS